jgi:hypothetical protein
MTRVSSVVTVDGVTRTRTEWCEYLGITSALISQRIRQGCTIEDAIRQGGRKGSAVERARAAKKAMPLPDVPLQPIANTPGYYVTEDGRVWNHEHKRWLKISAHTPNPGKPHKQYARVRIAGVQRYVQTVVAEAWLENPSNLPWIWHRDGNTLNNHKDNLVWATVQGVHDYRKERRKKRVCRCLEAS